MKAVLVSKDTVELVDRPIPSPGKDEILIKSEPLAEPTPLTPSLTVSPLRRRGSSKQSQGLEDSILYRHSLG